jgi:hypothetical protein
MSRLLKIELDLPEFEKELNINITIKKDGEVVYSASSPSGNVEVAEKVKEPAPEKKKKSSGKSASGGNFMNLDL